LWVFDEALEENGFKVLLKCENSFLGEDAILVAKKSQHLYADSQKNVNCRKELN
jgi:hypothetical protein